ncbi:MAG: DNA repair protein RecO [Henriciella sp.]|nr:DNA repair protein RecO [Henriciella sp.]
MQWRDEALILGGRKFGESGLILDVLTATHGRRSGLVYGGASRKKRPQLEAGNTVEVAWTGRLEEQLGRFDVAEARISRAAYHLDNALILSGITAVTAILRDALDEGDAAGSALYDPTTLLLDTIEATEIWPALYVRWELGLLSTLGFGLDLDQCALSGANDGLTHVSPKTGRAVRGSEAEDYVDRLFALPAFLLDPNAPTTDQDIENGLALTGHFLDARIFAAINRPTPEARSRLVAKIISKKR